MMLIETGEGAVVLVQEKGNERCRANAGTGVKETVQEI
jgi:hypothetical protein